MLLPSKDTNMNNQSAYPPTEVLLQQNTFLLTKEYHLFEEFCLACRKDRYIGLCYGNPGVGKTLSARFLANWELYRKTQRPYLNIHDAELEEQDKLALIQSDVFFYTTPVLAAPKKTRKELREGIYKFAIHLRQLRRQMGKAHTPLPYCRLIIIDEADRLKLNTLEELRDIFDHLQIGMVLIGMPGIEKRMACYPQFYSRIGFAHHFRSLDQEQAQPVIEQLWNNTQAKWQPNNPDQLQAISAIYSITQGNFRLLQRVFQQIHRILKINQLHTINLEVVQTAKDCLVIGNT